MEYVSVMMEYMKLSKQCFPSSKAVWLLQLAVVALALHSLLRYFSFLWLFFRSPSPSSIKRRKRKKKRPPVTIPDTNTCLLVPDEAVSKCTGCGSDFSAFNRRHHCRNCGDIFCDKCTQARTSLTSEENAQPVRVCDRCMAEVTHRLSKGQEAASRPVTSCVAPTLRKFTYQSLVDATQDFISERSFGFDYVGQVFMGNMVDTDEVFAIRKIWVDVTHSLEEFEARVSLLSQANHPNLAKLIGYCAERWKRLLVYEYVPGGSLDDYLYDKDKCLDWNVRMKIALGVSMALDYLQNTMKPSILHLYLKPCNIWLDEEYTPKLSGFGLVGIYPPGKSVDFPRKMIGSYCYARPDYQLTKTVTHQTDIYGFGILLLQIITGKKEYVDKDGLSQRFTNWVQPYLKDKQKMSEMVDPKLEGAFENDELYEVCQIAEMCLNEQPDSRPLIVDLVKRMNRLVKRNYDM